MKIYVPNAASVNSGSLEQEWVPVTIKETCANCEHFMGLDYDVLTPNIAQGKTSPLGLCKCLLDNNMKDGVSLHEAIYNAVITDDDTECEFENFFEPFLKMPVMYRIYYTDILAVLKPSCLLTKGLFP